MVDISKDEFQVKKDALFSFLIKTEVERPEIERYTIDQIMNLNWLTASYFGKIWFE